MPRRHDIDALRVIAFAILILYHVSGVYQVGSDFHIVSTYRNEWLDYVRIVFNRWRMPLLFAISGVAIGLSLSARRPGRFALLRTWRLLLPLVFGMFFVVSIQAYCEGVSKGMLEPGFGAFLAKYLQLRPWPKGTFTGAEYGVTWNHLWYLAYLWIYTLILMALAPLLASGAGQRLLDWLARLRHGLLLLLPAVVFFAYLMLLQPRFPGNHALIGDWYLHAEYFSVFVLGYAVAGKADFWQRVRQLRWPMLVIAVASISVELSLKAAGQYLPAEQVPVALQGIPWGTIERGARALYMWSALLAIFGWGYTLLNRPMRWLPYATEAVYPWYILHQSLIVLVAYWLIPLQLGPWWEPVLVIALTLLGCLVLHEFVIRRIAVLRPLFGLKLVPRTVRPLRDARRPVG
ncbi:MAG: acyltransferase family protein [Lysobacter sp.]